MALARVGQRAVLGHVLLFHRGDFGIQLARQRVGEQRADVHVVVVGLVFRAGDKRRVDLGNERGGVLLVVVADVVFRMTMVLRCFPPGHDIGIALQDVVGILALEAIEHRRVAVQVIEVFQQAEAIGLRLVGVGLILRHGRGHLDGHLFVGDGGFQRRVVDADQPVDHGRLVLLDAADLGQRQAQLLVEARNAVLEAQGVGLHAVHEDDAHTGKRIVIEFADRLAGHFLPCELLLLQWRAFVIENSGNGLHGASVVMRRYQA